MYRLRVIASLSISSGLTSFALGCAEPESPNVEAGDAESGASESGTSEAGSESETDDGESGDSGDQSCPGPGPRDYGTPIPAGAPLTGDPNAGLLAMLNDDYVDCGIPYDLFQLGKGFLGTYADGESFDWRPGKNATVPYNWNVITSDGGTDLAVMNCLTCHAGSINGELFIGLGRTDVDYTTDFTGLLNLLPVLPDITDSGMELNKFRERYSALGPYIQMPTIGSNPALMVAILLASHYNPYTLAWSDEPLIDVMVPMTPADTPPWWRVAKKHGHFDNGMSRGDHRGTMMFASSLCTDSATEVAEHLDEFADIEAYLASLQPPPYPWPVDEALAAEGRAIFECDCSGCHGTYSDDPDDETYPNLLIPIDVIGTDDTIVSGVGGIDAMVDWFNESWYGSVGELVDAFEGYLAPPLDGIWATAPFFHNGSVPNLALVLDSSARPAQWKRIDYDTTNYDQTAVGWPWLDPGYGQDAAPLAERKFIYDTSKPGHSAAGHTFGDHLTSQERAAVVEYLKTL
jgi:mono/diheme cytochrome c family protein